MKNFSLTCVLQSRAAVPMEARMRLLVRAACAERDPNAMTLPSGAGHDAMCVARVAPTAMVFVPCEDGISHNEVENATPGDIAAGCNVLLQAMLTRANAP